jgi:superfamily II DNA or RNA helicase
MTAAPTLRPYQIEPVDWLTKQERGLLVAPAGSGKTRMALTALSRIRNPDSRFLWLAHTREQVAQAQAAQADVCPDLNIEFACYAGIWNATYLRVRYTHVICDEAHHLAKTSWGKMVKEADLKFLWLLTATPFSGDWEGDQFMRSLFKEYYVLEMEEVRRAGGLVPTQVFWYPTVAQNPMDDEILQKRVDKLVEHKIEQMLRFNKNLGHTTALQRATWAVNHTHGIVHCNQRNSAVIQALNDCLKIPDSRILILVNHVEHAENLINLDQQNLGDALVHGKTPLKQRKQKLQEFTAGDRQILLGTASLFGEGFDAPMLSHLINAAGGKSPISIVQRAGRSSRVADGKSMGYVVDFGDFHLRTLGKHRVLRGQIYKSLGYTQKSVTP